MSRTIAFHLVVLAFGPGLLGACASNSNSGEWVSWAGKEIHIPGGYELGEIGFSRQRYDEDGQHTHRGPPYTWAEIVESATGDVVGLLICEQFSCMRRPLSFFSEDPVYDGVMQQIVEGARGPFDDCDPLKERCEEE